MGGGDPLFFTYRMDDDGQEVACFPGDLLSFDEIQNSSRDVSTEPSQVPSEQMNDLQNPPPPYNSSLNTEETEAAMSLEQATINSVTGKSV